MVFGKIFGSSFPSIPTPTTTARQIPRIKTDSNGNIRIKTGPIDLEDIKETVEDVIKISKKLSNFLKDLQEEKALTKGDVIGVSRGLYEHYGVYIGNNRVIHYTSLNSDISMQDNKIMETGMDHFLRDAGEFFILDCTYKNKAVKSKPIKAGFLVPDYNQLFERQSVFSPEETVKRAKSRLGETKYSLAFNNCEHFAIWCKTGLSKSHQVDAFLGTIERRAWRI